MTGPTLSTYTTTATNLIPGRGLCFASDGALVSVHAANGSLTVLRVGSDGSQLTISLATKVTIGALGGDGNNVSVCYVVADRTVWVQDSSDGGVTWGKAVQIGTCGAGTPGPTVCRSGQTGWAGFVTSATTDGVGSITLATRSPTGWSTGVLTGITTAVNCAVAPNWDGTARLVWRDERDGQKTVQVANWFTAISGQVKVANGYDPSVCVYGGKTYVGYHNMGIGYIAEVGGSTFACNPGKGSKFVHCAADSSGKYLMVSGYPTTTDASNSKASDSIRTVLFYADQGSGWVEYKPVGDTVGQLSPEGVCTTSGRLGLGWRVATGFVHARYTV